MNRIDRTFRRLKKEKKKAFIAYITAGDPDIAVSESVARALAERGADIIELGIPFSDPLADGPTIQRAIQRSLDAGCTVKKVFAMTASIRKMTDVPLVFMTYYNIVFNYGLEKFAKDAKSAGADGIIIPDLPMEEAEEFKHAADREDLCLIMLTAPTTSGERFKRIAAKSRGFIYYVSRLGVTGAKKTFSSGLERDIRALKKLTTKPVCAGFGISTPTQAGKISGTCDGVIVGSAIIDIIEKNLSRKKELVKRVGSYAASMAKAIHGK
ncbi:MAG: tryptophan synthase subunit alpha [Candidatus Omnitrophota bacterium]|nr:tryptophan synthase subunit alpha [Candidatus Omnitrophota bacterium]